MANVREQHGIHEMLRLMRDKHTDILDSIRTEKQITDAMAPKLKAAVDAYAKAFA